jgi:hypothetical protein
LFLWWRTQAKGVFVFPFLSGLSVVFLFAGFFSVFLLVFVFSLFPFFYIYSLPNRRFRHHFYFRSFLPNPTVLFSVFIVFFAVFSAPLLPGAFVLNEGLNFFLPLLPNSRLFVMIFLN